MRVRIGAVAVLLPLVYGACARYSAKQAPAPARGWTALAPLPTARFLGPQVAAMDGMLYAVGGLVREDGRYLETGKLEVFIPRLGSWINADPLPTPRADLAAVAVRGRLLAIGGKAGDRPLATVEAYDAGDHRWVRRADMSVPRYHHAAAAVGSNVYVIGGRGTARAFERYDARHDRWTRLPDLATPRENPYAATLGERIYVLGGDDGRGGEDHAHFEEYDPATGAWRTLEPLPTPRTDVALAALDGKLYVIGGWTPGGLSTAVDVYDPASGHWRSAPPLPRPLSFAGAAGLRGLLLVAGGADYAGDALVPFRSLLLWRPQ